MADINTNEIEAANRAEATAILIRAGYRVYRPEADVDGEDLVIRTREGDLRSVQMKGRPLVHSKLYGGKGMWMLFPEQPDAIPGRHWFLIPHDELFKWFQDQHPKARGWAQRQKAGKPEWSEKNVGAKDSKLRRFLKPFKH